MIRTARRVLRLDKDAHRLEQRVWRLLAHIERADTRQRVENTGQRLRKLQDERDALMALARPLPAVGHVVTALDTLRRVSGALARAEDVHTERRFRLERSEAREVQR